MSECEDCPPAGYPTDETRCLPCLRRAVRIYHCANCNRDYDIALQGALCPHETRESGNAKDRLPPWPKSPQSRSGSRT
jgi:hypothetical protein